MTFRRAALGLFRTVWLTAAWTAVTIAALYVFIATPAGTWIVARLAERELSRVAGIEADIRGLRTDLFTHVRLGRSTLALPDGTTRISVDRVVLRYSLIGIVRGLAGSVERVDVDGLSATIEASGEETPDDALPFEWSVKPYAPFAPQYVAVDKCELAIVEGDEATRFALETARFTVGEPGADSSLAISAIMQGALPGGERIGELPFRIVANVALADSSLHVLDLTASAPGFECRASGQMADLTTGPYVADIDLSVLLDEIPSAAADVELSGLVRLAGGVEWSESPGVGVECCRHPMGHCRRSARRGRIGLGRAGARRRRRHTLRRRPRTRRHATHVRSAGCVLGAG